MLKRLLLLLLLEVLNEVSPCLVLQPGWVFPTRLRWVFYSIIDRFLQGSLLIFYVLMKLSTYHLTSVKYVSEMLELHQMRTDAFFGLVSI